MHFPLLALAALITTTLSVPPRPSQPTSTNNPHHSLLTIFSLPSYAGSTYISTGSYGTCHDLPGSVEKDVKSIKLGPSVASCTLYRVKGCREDKGVLAIDRDIEVEHMGTVESLSCVPGGDEKVVL